MTSLQDAQKDSGEKHQKVEAEVSFSSYEDYLQYYFNEQPRDRNFSNATGDVIAQYALQEILVPKK